VAIGAGALAVTRYLAPLLPGVDPKDPLALGAAVLLMVLCGSVGLLGSVAAGYGG